jgi:hypothetical protein
MDYQFVTVAAAKDCEGNLVCGTTERNYEIAIGDIIRINNGPFLTVEKAEVIDSESETFRLIDALNNPKPITAHYRKNWEENSDDTGS